MRRWPSLQRFGPFGRSGLIGLIGLVWLLLTGAAAALAAGPEQPVLALQGTQAPGQLQGWAYVWLEPGREAGPQQAAERSAAGGFLPHPIGQPYALDKDNSLWIRLRLTRAPGDPAQWMLQVPVPFIDHLSLFQRDAQGHWKEQLAGDALPHREWSRPGLTPAFKLALADHGPQEVFLRVRNYVRADLPLRLTTEDAHALGQSFESLALGLALGLLLTFFGLSCLRYAQHRASSDLAAAAYTLLMAATVAQINGVLNASLWQQLPLIANYASRVIASVAVAGSLLYMRELYALSIHYHRFDRFLGSMGLAAIVFAFGVLLLDPVSSNQMESLIFVLATAVALTGALLSWRAGSPIWLWLLLATAPQALSVLWLAAEDMDLVLPLWEIRYVSSFFLTTSVPLMAFALSKVTHDRKEREQRTLHLATQDALTGLLTPDAFSEQLQDALTRVREHREPVALALVRLNNYEHIVREYGTAMGEQSELRAVVKLHRVLRDVDPAARVRAGRYALLLEGVRTRDQLNERIVKLIASGLIPQPGLVPEVPLQFHAACVLLQERPLDPESALDLLEELLATMAPGTRRPIRFIDAQDTLPYEGPQIPSGLRTASE